MPRKPPETRRLSQTAVLMVHRPEGVRHRWYCWLCKPQGKGRAAAGHYHADREQARMLLDEHLTRVHPDYVRPPSVAPFEPFTESRPRRHRPRRARPGQARLIL